MTEEAPKSGFRPWMIVPLLGALAVLVAFAGGLEEGRDSSVLPSVLVGKTVPEFALPGLGPDDPGFATADLTGPGVKLVNIWASWCGPCRVEHPYITQLAEEGVPIYGINYKDAPDAAQAFLDELGNPYTGIGADRNARIGIEFGVYGVPETFVIGPGGVILHRHVGPLVSRNLDAFRAEIDKASAAE